MTLQQLRQIFFVDWCFPALQGGVFRRVVVDQNDFVSDFCKTGAGDEADVTATYDCDAHLSMVSLWWCEDVVRTTVCCNAAPLRSSLCLAGRYGVPQWL